MKGDEIEELRGEIVALETALAAAFGEIAVLRATVEGGGPAAALGAMEAMATQLEGSVLRGVVGAAPERVIGRDVAAWLPPSPLLRRLQNEMQMLLYTHAVSERRAERGALAVNSFWLSGCGVLAALPTPTQELTVLDALTQPAVHADWAAWARAWQALDEELAPLQAALAAGQDVTLTLCSELVARRYTPAPRSAWRRLLQRFRPQSLSDILVAS